MHETIRNMAQEFVKQREKRRRACAAFTALAILVSISTTYLLVQPASTMAADTAPYICGMKEHVHSDECYSAVPLCGYEDAEDTMGAAPEQPDLTDDPAEETDVPLAGEAPEAEDPTAEEPVVEEPVTEEPAVEEPVTEAPVTEEPAIEEPAVEEPTVEEPVAEAPAVEEPAVEEPTVEEPTVEEPVAEAPAVEEPVTEEPVVEESAAEAPAQEISSEPVAEQPAQEPSGSETFSGGSIEKKLIAYTNGPEESSEEPVVEEPVVEEPVVEEPVVEEPAVEEPVVEEPVVEEPVVEEPAVEEPVVEEPVAEEPVVEEPVVEEPVVEEPVVEEPVAEEPVVEEPAAEEPAVEEPEVEEEHSHKHETAHVHTDECYLKCGKEEHIHDEACFPEDMMAFLPEGVEIPEGYYPMPPACGEGYSVTVYAPMDALPEDAVLEAILLTEGDAYENAEQTLKAMAAKEIEVTVGGVMSEDALAEAAASVEATVSDETSAEEPVVEAAQEETPVSEVDAEVEAEEPSAEEPPAEEPVADEPGVEESEEVQETEPEEQSLEASLLHMTSGPEDAASEEEPVAEPEDETVEEPEVEEPTAEEPAAEEPIPYEEEFSYDGFVALDIHFLQNGEEIKPTKPVFVAINVNGLLPDDVDPASVAIQHHVEAKEEEKSALQETVENLIPALASEPVVESVEMVADGNDNTGTVEATGEDAAALFAVDSFSTFTVTYSQLKQLNTDGAMVFMADEILPKLSTFTRMSASDVLTDGSGDKYLKLTSDYPTADKTRVDPYVSFAIGETLNIDQFDQIVIAYKANEACNGKEMELYLTGPNHASANEDWVARSTLVGNNSMQYIYFDLSIGNLHKYLTAEGKTEHEGREISGFRMDFVRDHAEWTKSQRGEMDIYAIYLRNAAPERNDDITDNSIENIKINLFDYSYWINKSSKTADADGNYPNNPISTDFGFSGGGVNSKQAVSRNASTDADGYTANRVKVKPVLLNGSPVVVANNGSLDYLFDPDTTNHAVTAYEPTNTILQKEGTHYSYDSSTNAVDYDHYNNEFHVRSYAERNSTTAGNAKKDGSYYGDFHPFNYTQGVELGTGTKAPYHVASADVNYWYGMTMEFNFQMQNDGKIVVDNGDGTTSEIPMIFEFSGDDDVWVFIDDVLVLDLGGTHGTVDGSINFETGQILQYLTWGGANSTDKQKTEGSNTSFPTTLKQCYTNAGKDPKGGWNANGETFANYSTHTLKFFYLERAASVANCKLNFNMPIVPENALTVEKVLDYANGSGVAPDRDYTFRVLKTLNSTDTVLSGYPYTVKDQGNATVGTGTTTADGLLTLKAGQKAVFEHLEVHAEETYKVQELIPQEDAKYYTKVSANGTEVKANGTQTYNDVVYDVYTSAPQSFVVDGVAMSPTFAFTNQLQTRALTITKEALYLGSGTFSGDTTFDMDVTVDGVKLPVGTKYTLVNADGSEIPDVEVTTAGIVSLKNGQMAKLTLLYNSSYEVKETMASSAGFSVRYEIDGTACTESKAAGTILNDTAVKVTNTTGPELPSTGGTGTHIYTILGTVMMLSAGVLLLDQRRRREGTSSAT